MPQACVRRYASGTRFPHIGQRSGTVVDEHGHPLHNSLVTKLDRASTRLIVLFMLPTLLCSCGGNAPAPTAVEAAQFDVLSDTADAAGRCLVSIKLSGAVSETQAKAAAESVLNSRRSKCRSITVRSYLNAGDATPFLVSSLDGNGVSHQFGRQADQTRIPTH